ncbi:miaA, partial [Symbiodinium pilosum]
MGQNAGSCCAEACCEDAEKNAFGRGVPPPVYFAEDLPEAVQTTDRYVHSSFTEENSQHGPQCMEVSGLASVAATSPSRSPPLREDAFRRTSTPYTFTARQDRLEQEAQLYVDTEIARSISLVSTLQGFGWLWRVRPERMSHVQLDALWKTSTQADAYDVFLSHTWATPGHLKYLSLLLSSCWHQVFLAWALAAVLVMALYVLNLLPLPLRVPRNENLVFEIAAYRRANPNGELKVQPMFVERNILLAWICMFLCLGVFMFVRLPGIHWRGAVGFFVFFPGIHVIRKGYQQQEQMFRDLAEFDLNSVSCSNEFDRQFILSAVCRWYGSLQGFTDYVRGPLKEELTEAVVLARMPLQYCILSISPLAGFQLDYIASFLSIASPDIIARVILTQVLAVNTTVVLATYFLFWLCQRFATPRFSSCAMDYVQTALIL